MAEDADILKYTVTDVRFDHAKKQVIGYLRMPSELPQRYGTAQEQHCPEVVLDVRDLTEDNERCLSLMKKIHHVNILQARTVTSDLESKKFVSWVEPYDGILLDYLRDTRLGSTVLGNSSKKKLLLPNFCIFNIVSQIANGIEHLVRQGHYHGNLSLKSTYYCKDPNNSTIIVKLCNFKKHDDKRSICQANDWKSLGCEVDCISKIAKEFNETLKYECFDTCQLDSFAKMLSQTNSDPKDLRKQFQRVKEDVFFWGRLERKKFHVYRLPMALKTESFVRKLKECGEHCRVKCTCSDICDLPWGGSSDRFSVLLSQMTSLREKRSKGSRTGEGTDTGYDVNSRVSFVQCCSGAHTHEYELSAVAEFIVHKAAPRLCWKLNSMLPKAGPAQHWI